MEKFTPERYRFDEVFVARLAQAESDTHQLNWAHTNMPGSLKRREWRHPDFYYEDVFRQSERSLVGTKRIIYRDGSKTHQWFMQYQGLVFDSHTRPGRIHNFLSEVLRHPDPQAPVFGPKEYTDARGYLFYDNQFEGTLEDFKGLAVVNNINVADSREVAHIYYHGGAFI